MLKQLIVFMLSCVFLSTVVHGEFANRVLYYLDENSNTTASARNGFELQDDGSGPYISEWSVDGVVEPEEIDLPSDVVADRWKAANRVTLPLERTFTNQLAQAGSPSPPIIPGQFSTIYAGLLAAVQVETNLTTKIDLHTLAISLDATYQELRRLIETDIYSPWLGTTNSLEHGPLP